MSKDKKIKPGVYYCPRTLTMVEVEFDSMFGNFIFLFRYEPADEKVYSRYIRKPKFIKKYTKYLGSL